MSAAATPRPPGRRRPAPLRDARVVLRERPEAGCARVMGFEAIWAETEARAGKGRPSQEHPYGTGDAARRIVDIIENYQN